jgi:signal transduction histidine kinase
MTFALGAGVVSIGRAEDQTLCIPHGSLSRQHARIECVNGDFFVVDLQSKNGTCVNGVPIRRQRLQPGDKVTLGDLVFCFLEEMAPHGTWEAPLDAEAPQLRPQAVRALARVPLEKLVRGPESHGSRLGEAESSAERSQTRLRILLEVAKLLSAADSIDTLLSKVLDLAFQILPVDRGAILLLDEKAAHLEPRVVKTKEGLGEQGAIYSQNIVDYVLHRSVAVLFSDAQSDPRLGAAESVVVQSIRASMCVPLKPKDDVIGVLYVDNLTAPNGLSEEDLEFLVAFASQAAIALENAALYRRIERETVERMQLIMDAKLASLGALVGGIAHELRNPLNFVNNFAGLSVGAAEELTALLRGPQVQFSAEARVEAEELLAYLQANALRVVEHGRRADTIIHGMLLHTSRPAEAREARDLNTLVAESVSLGLCGRGTQPEVRVEAEYAPSVGAVEMVGAILGRVFINIVDNALYAMRQKQQQLGEAYSPLLRVRTVDRGERVEVRIRDNGPGIPPDIAGKIFDPFFTTKPPGQGTGLGLSLSHEIVVRSHQGSLRMETDPGQFTEFIITLPRRSLVAERG